MISEASEVAIRALGAPDEAAVARVHLAAFPRSALSALGLEALRRYYRWQLSDVHESVGLGAFRGSELLGFCVAGVFRGSLTGFLRNNRGYLAWRVLTHPWLLASPLFRDRLTRGLGTLRRHWQFDKSAPVAAAPLSEERWGRKSFGILAIAVHPDGQGLGIGRLMMDETEAIARERGYRQMNLCVQSDNPQAVGFYEHLGWERVSEPGQEKIDMRKLLESDAVASV
jgi:ribosomal protein S18 acetylase RimI-like enzyme